MFMLRVFIFYIQLTNIFCFRKKKETGYPNEHESKQGTK